MCGLCDVRGVVVVVVGDGLEVMILQGHYKVDKRLTRDAEFS